MGNNPQYIEQTLFQRDGRGMNKPGNMQVLYLLSAVHPEQISSGNYDYNSQISWSDGKTCFCQYPDDRDFVSLIRMFWPLMYCWGTNSINQ